MNHCANHCANDMPCDHCNSVGKDPLQFLALCPLNLHSDYPTRLDLIMQLTSLQFYSQGYVTESQMLWATVEANLGTWMIFETFKVAIDKRQRQKQRKWIHTINMNGALRRLKLKSKIVGT